MDRTIKLGTFLTVGGEHVSSWRHPSVEFTDKARFRYYLEAARMVEDALFDLILLADVAPSAKDPVEVLARLAGYDRLEPAMLAAALAVTTRRIGIVTTLSTTYEEPYHVARRIASLDHLSEGRSGWNIVTTANETDAFNFGRTEHPPAADRYQRAGEFVDVVRGLWKSWDRDAFIRDKETGFYFEPSKLRLLNHRDRHFSVRGPLDVIPTPQSQPVLVQAGSSEAGRDLGSRVADVIFSTHQSMASAKAFGEDIRARAVAHDRDPRSITVMMALVPVIGETEKEARRKFNEIMGLLDPAIAIPQLQLYFQGVDLSAYPLDEPLPENLPSGSGQGTTSRRGPILELARREGLTLRQLAQVVAGTRGHWTLVGTPKSIADEMESWFLGGAADGFLLVPPILPDSLKDFIDSVVPELQRRSLFRTAYRAGTLRDNLGLPS